MKRGDLILANDKNIDPNNLTDEIGLVVDSDGENLTVLLVNGGIETGFRRSYYIGYYRVISEGG